MYVYVRHNFNVKYVRVAIIPPRRCSLRTSQMCGVVYIYSMMVYVICVLIRRKCLKRQLCSKRGGSGRNLWQLHSTSPPTFLLSSVKDKQLIFRHTRFVCFSYAASEISDVGERGTLKNAFSNANYAQIHDSFVFRTNICSFYAIIQRIVLLNSETCVLGSLKSRINFNELICIICITLRPVF